MFYAPGQRQIQRSKWQRLRANAQRKLKMKAKQIAGWRQETKHRTRNNTRHLQGCAALSCVGPPLKPSIADCCSPARKIEKLCMRSNLLRFHRMYANPRTPVWQNVQTISQVYVPYMTDGDIPVNSFDGCHKRCIPSSKKSRLFAFRDTCNDRTWMAKKLLANTPTGPTEMAKTHKKSVRTGRREENAR